MFTPICRLIEVLRNSVLCLPCINVELVVNNCMQIYPFQCNSIICATHFKGCAVLDPTLVRETPAVKVVDFEFTGFLQNIRFQHGPTWCIIGVCCLYWRCVFFSGKCIIELDIAFPTRLHVIKNRISLHTRAIWSVSSQGALWRVKDLKGE